MINTARELNIGLKMACKTSCVLLVLYSCILWTIIHGSPVRDKVTSRDQVTAVVSIWYLQLLYSHSFALNRAKYFATISQSK